MIAASSSAPPACATSGTLFALGLLLMGTSVLYGKYSPKLLAPTR